MDDRIVGSPCVLALSLSSPPTPPLDGKGDLVITARAENYKGDDGITRPYTSEGSPNASTHFPAQMLVEWVRVWQ
jgi:hypothetical protein